jgi:hypothetical protein
VWSTSVIPGKNNAYCQIIAPVKGSLRAEGKATTKANRRHKTKLRHRKQQTLKQPCHLQDKYIIVPSDNTNCGYKSVHRLLHGWYNEETSPNKGVNADPPDIRQFSSTLDYAGYIVTASLSQLPRWSGYPKR